MRNTIPRTVIAMSAVLVGSARAQQPQSNRVVHVVVTEPRDRFVTGLEQSQFAVVENGVQRSIVSFLDSGSPISIAIVGLAAPADAVQRKRAEDELILTASLGNALRELAVAKNARKAIVVATGADTQGVPESIQVIATDPGNLSTALIEILNSYSLGFASSDASSTVEVTLRPAAGLPPLKVTRK